MRLFNSAVTRRLTDPDFQGIVVDRSLLLNIALAGVVIVFAAHDAYIRAHPPTPLYFYVDGQNAPRPAVALTSPVLGQDQLLGWAVKWAIAPWTCNGFVPVI
ncbi:DotI/IcmL/TraM family protein [Komagataeibacter europaeus]|uniref:DotI/IcmL/TraM family protein n=1 Tax=Komagataeibacter europaeus TaxID=33995 RepID=UPI000237E2C3|nr:DotI/IcmL/TraM family protein [Komagataeibacter europaeus]